MKKTSQEKAKSQEPPDVDPSFAPVVAAFAKDRQVSRKRMFSTSNALNVNGKIFAMLVKGKFVAKLPKTQVDDLVKGGRGKYFDPGHGRLMKEWVAVESDEASWVALAKEAYRFVKDGKQ